MEDRHPLLNLVNNNTPVDISVINAEMVIIVYLFLTIIGLFEPLNSYPILIKQRNN